ncbi:MAG: M56 family metallopeptidase [Fibrobacter sp.]|jgi:Zn-dependent protease with chaperone function|nr:M56 family metallopeptidase [Fibrobacter sp.]
MNALLFGFLTFEFIFRLVIEIRQMRFSGKFSSTAILHLIPLVNNCIPMRDLRAAALPETPFIKAHETAHLKMRHQTLRSGIRISGFGILFFTLIYAWNYSGATLLLSILLFHLILSFLQVLWNAVCWFQEYEADAAAFKVIGKAGTEKSLAALIQKEIPKQTLYALLYQEHPPATRRLEKIKTRKR